MSSKWRIATTVAFWRLKKAMHKIDCQGKNQGTALEPWRKTEPHFPFEKYFCVGGKDTRYNLRLPKT